MGWLLLMAGGMEENKKSGGGDVRAKALSWDIEREKAKNVFFGFLPLAPTVARCARHSHPSPPEKKAASRRKSRLRRKKTAPVSCRTAVYGDAGAGGGIEGRAQNIAPLQVGGDRGDRL